MKQKEYPENGDFIKWKLKFDQKLSLLVPKTF